MNKKINITTKSLCVILGVISLSVFTLTIAYAALNSVLTIQGSAQVSSANWDIHLANPKVKTGSATTNVPILESANTLKYSTTLNMPGDFYEFTVEVVNNGSIDAMIEKVVKTPELTAEQAKYLKYEVSYANGESITTDQTIAKGSSMPIKVRIEYRKDLSSSDLPTGQVVLDLALTLEYIQSDGTGSTVVDNGYSLIEFTIAGTTYQAKEGMTWNEWVNSEYNTTDLYTNTTSNVIKSDAKGCISEVNNPNDLISNTINYTYKNCSGGAHSGGSGY